jgi:hypothetical protein
MKDKRRQVQQDSGREKNSTEHEESQKREGMNPKQADRFDAQSYDQQAAGEPERHGKFASTGGHS